VSTAIFFAIAILIALTFALTTMRSGASRQWTKTRWAAVTLITFTIGLGGAAILMRLFVGDRLMPQWMHLFDQFYLIGLGAMTITGIGQRPDMAVRNPRFGTLLLTLGLFSFGFSSYLLLTRN